MTSNRELTSKELLTEMRVEVVLSHVATMPIPLYYKIKEQLTATQQALDRAVEALKFYAVEDNYQDGVIGSIQRYGWGEDWGNDNGEIARETLKELGVL